MTEAIAERTTVKNDARDPGPVLANALCRHDRFPIAPSLGSSHEFSVIPHQSGNMGVSFAFEVFGVRIGISLHDPALLPGIIGILPPGWKPIEQHNLDCHYRLEWLHADHANVSQSAYYLFAQDEIRRRMPTLELAVEALESAIERYLAEHSRGFLYMHAGVVGWQGRAIVLPGSSHAGKSTLVHALVDAGAAYFSDEYAVFDMEGNVYPYPRPLSLREGPCGSARSIDLVGTRGRTGRETEVSLPVGLVALTRYVTGSEWNINRLDEGSAMMALCQHTLALRQRPAEAFALMGKVIQASPVFQGVRGEARDAARWLLDMGRSGDKEF